MSSKATTDTTRRGGPGGPTVELPAADETDPSPDREQIFEVLSNERRRYVLAYLKQDDDSVVDVGTLITHVAAMENDVGVDEVDSTARKSVYVGLRQSHLPKMDEYGLVDYDADRGEVQLTDGAEKARMYLEYVPENDIPWCYHYVGLSTIMGLLSGLVWGGVWPFAGLGWLELAVMTIVVFGLSAAVHTVYTHRHTLGHEGEPDAAG